MEFNHGNLEKSSGRSTELSLLTEESLDDGEVVDSGNDSPIENIQPQEEEEEMIPKSRFSGPHSPEIQPASPPQTATTSPIKTSPSVGSSEYLQSLMRILDEHNEQDSRYIQVLQQLSPYEFTEKIKQVEDWAYRLGILEAKESEKGKALNILSVREDTTITTSSNGQSNENQDGQTNVNNNSGIVYNSTTIQQQVDDKSNVGDNNTI